MAATPDSLGDYFAKKTKKKITSSNLNKEPSAVKTEAAKPKKKDEEEWQEEEQIVTTAIKVDTIGKLTRDDEKVEEDGGAVKWGNVKAAKMDDKNDRKFPTLQKSMLHQNDVSLKDGAKSGVSVARNHFSALDAEEEEEKAKKPTVAGKKKGEMIITSPRDAKEKKAKKSKKKDSDDEESEDEEEEAKQAAKKEEAKQKDAKEKAKAQDAKEQPDLQIKEDLEASKAKYEGRKKLPRKEIPASDREVTTTKADPKKKKVCANFEEEFDSKKKIQYLEE